MLAAAMVAGAGEGSWRPEPPMPDDFDWVQLVSGEWLKGDIVAMYKDSLELNSEELDELSLDWEDIREIRTAHVMQVALEDRSVVVGRLLLQDGTVRVLGEPGLEIPQEKVLSITAGEPKERNYWSGKLGAGFNSRTGNTDQTETNGHINLMRRTPNNRISLDYLGHFSQTDGTTTSDNQQAVVNWNRFLSHRFYLTPVNAEYYRDPFQNISSRWTLGVGVGYQIIDTPKVDWSADVGLAYQRTRFDTILPSESGSADTPALRVGTRYDNELTGWLDLFVDYRLFFVDKESGSYNHRFQTGLEIELIGDLTLDFSWIWDYTKDPRTEADGHTPQSDDFRTIFGIGYTF